MRHTIWAIEMSGRITSVLLESVKNCKINGQRLVTRILWQLMLDPQHPVTVMSHKEPLQIQVKCSSCKVTMYIPICQDN